MKKKRGAPVGNKNAEKDSDEKLNPVPIYCTYEERELWKTVGEASPHGNRSQWAREILNKAAKKKRAKK